MMRSTFNPLLNRQFRKSCRFEKGQEWRSFFHAIGELLEKSDSLELSLEARDFLNGLPVLFRRISDTYEQHERDLSIRQRSLELSSEELMTMISVMQEETDYHNNIFGSLLETAQKLGAETKLMEPEMDTKEELQQLCLLMDILVNERKKKEEELEKAKAIAIAANQSKDKFLATMSHEIRTPLNAILGFTEILSTQAEDPETIEYLDLIHGSGKSLSKLLSDILDINKIAENKLAFEEVPFPFLDTVSQNLAPYRFQAKEKGVGFELTHDAGMNRMVMADPMRISQILINLVSNALKFTHEGKISVHFARAEEKDGIEKNRSFGVKVYVSDTGSGVPEGAQQTIFDSFTQAKGEKYRNSGGSGLGLAIARQLANRMGGQIGLISPNPLVASGVENPGSMFWFTLYLKPAKGRMKIEGLAEPASPKQDFSGLRVLVAEDNPVNQILLKKILKDRGCEVSIVENGKEAVRQVALQSYDVVFMDIQMPVMDGYEATRKIREAGNQSIPVIACSAHVYNEDIQRSLESGMNDHLGKPYRMAEVERILSKWYPLSASA